MSCNAGLRIIEVPDTYMPEYYLHPILCAPVGKPVSIIDACLGLFETIVKRHMRLIDIVPMRFPYLFAPLATTQLSILLLIAI